MRVANVTADHGTAQIELLYLKKPIVATLACDTSIRATRDFEKRHLFAATALFATAG